VEILPALEARYQMHLTPLVDGADARTFAGDGLVFKVYSPETPSWQPGGIYAARLEALNMTKAGLGEWVVEAFPLNHHGILVIKRYPGSNFVPERFTNQALDCLAQFFVQLHTIREPGVVSQARLQDRLSQFGGTLHDLPQAQQLVGWLWQQVEEVAGTPQAFCHRDPHAGNILLKNPGAAASAAEARTLPEALVVDWVRAQPDDPARDLAILTTGTLVLLGEEKATRALQAIVRRYPQPESLWPRLRFWVPLTYLHDMHWFRTKEPPGFEAAVADKMPKALRFYLDFSPELT
jgi:thiamine kinase